VQQRTNGVLESKDRRFCARAGEAQYLNCAPGRRDAVRETDDMGKPADDKVRLYELVLENGRSVSPFVWRIRYALAHKGVPFECVPIGFTDIPKVFGGRFKTVPVIEHGSTMLAES
jgi:glutathione S-transferase-like protein